MSSVKTGAGKNVRSNRSGAKPNGRHEADAIDRRQRILSAAERLFSMRGYHGVSIRDIAQEAGVPLALVRYYFGPKLDLYHAIFRERAGYIQDRLEALAEAQRHAEPAELLDEIIKAFVLPVLEVSYSPDGRVFLRLLARGMSEQLKEDEPIIRELFDPLARAFIDAMTSAQPGMPREKVAWCYQFALGALLHHVTDDRIERLSPGVDERHRRKAGELLVRFIIAGMRGVYSDAGADG